MYTQKTGDPENENMNGQLEATILSQNKKSASLKNLLGIKERETKTFSSQEWLMIIQGADVKNTPQFEIQASLRKGIPHCMYFLFLSFSRPRVWFWLAETDKKYEKLHFEDIYLKFKKMDSVWSNDISKDVPRTYSNLEYFQSKETQNKLYSILKAYTNYDKEIGYTQGMNFVVATLLYHLDPKHYENKKLAYGEQYSNKEIEFECRVFWLFVYINFEKNWRLVYKTGTPKALSLVRILEKRIELEVPEVFYHMEEAGIDVQMSFDQAFITILLYYTPLDFSKRIIDMFLLGFPFN